MKYDVKKLKTSPYGKEYIIFR